ncbi:hypothetical protein NDU88_003917 [Pleurodeles waltl]|uniref:Uncharacterized protein n=1 Tax=Pleurodeles waltl TaxID=8319 RepID=A0AAV7TPR8_PLEWA|nr:hypothetical protein NDU88_003917 [Pleurodeles waltl]
MMVCRPAIGKPTQHCPGAVLATGENDPDREILRSNEDLEVEEGGTLKEKGKEKTRDLRQRRDQQSNGGPETQRSDQEAERHYNRPHSGESVTSSGISAKKDDLEKALKACEKAGKLQALLEDEITPKSGD